jgi:type II secretory pathway component PulM
MSNRMITITRDQAQALSEALKDCLRNENVLQIRIDITDESIQLTTHTLPLRVKL